MQRTETCGKVMHDEECRAEHPNCGTTNPMLDGETKTQKPHAGSSCRPGTNADGFETVEGHAGSAAMTT
jgi:hypothetical protein